MAETGIHTILALFTTISIVNIIKPMSPPNIANIHVKAVKNIIPATDSAALFVTDVAVPPCPVPALDMISSKNTQTSAIPEFTNAMAETIVGTIDFFFTD